MDYPKLIAHRGLHGADICENSMSAFKAAVDEGYAIELDVRLTKDCRLIVFHDENLLRMTGIDARPEEFTYEQLKAFTLKGSDEKIPLLKDVLKLVGGKVALFIEIKSSSLVGVAEKRLNALMKGYKGDWAVMSFDLRRVLWFRIFAPSVTRGVLLSRFKSKPAWEYFVRLISAVPGVWNFVAKPDYIACDLRSADIKDVIEAFNRDVKYISWTAKGDDLFSEAEKFSGSVIFENVSKDILSQH